MERQLKISLLTQAVVPDVIREYPTKVLRVVYENDVEVDMGNILTPKQVRNMPSVQYEADPQNYYTLCMTDPDAPSRENPKYREWHHWLVGNIPGNNIQKGNILSEYIGLSPLLGTGFHRYVFLLYKQPNKISFHEIKLKSNSLKNRGKFSIIKFARKYELGSAIAGNFFQAEYDDTVPILRKQLSWC